MIENVHRWAGRILCLLLLRSVGRDLCSSPVFNGAFSLQATAHFLSGPGVLCRVGFYIPHHTGTATGKPNNHPFTWSNHRLSKESKCCLFQTALVTAPSPTSLPLHRDTPDKGLCCYSSKSTMHTMPPPPVLFLLQACDITFWPALLGSKVPCVCNFTWHFKLCSWKELGDLRKVALPTQWTGSLFQSREWVQLTGSTNTDDGSTWRAAAPPPEKGYDQSGACPVPDKNCPLAEALLETRKWMFLSNYSSSSMGLANM